MDLHKTNRVRALSDKIAFDNFVSNPLPVPRIGELNYLKRKYWFQNVLKQSIKSHLFSESLNTKKQNFRSFIIFRLKFIEQVNRKKKFYSQFSHFDLSPFFSSSNRIAAIMLGVSNNFVVNSKFSKSGYPVIEPYYMSNPAQSKIIGGSVSPRIFSFNLDPFSNNRVFLPSQIDKFSPFFDTFFTPENVYTIFEEELIDYELSDLELDGLVDRFFVSNKLARNIQFFDRLSKYINDRTQPEVIRVKDKTRRRAIRSSSNRDLWNFKRFGPTSYLFRKSFPTYQWSRKRISVRDPDSVFFQQKLKRVKKSVSNKYNLAVATPYIKNFKIQQYFKKESVFKNRLNIPLLHKYDYTFAIEADSDDEPFFTNAYEYPFTTQSSFFFSRALDGEVPFFRKPRFKLDQTRLKQISDKKKKRYYNSIIYLTRKNRLRHSIYRNRYFFVRKHVRISNDFSISNSFESKTIY